MVLDLVAHRGAFELSHGRPEEKEHVDEESETDANDALLDHGGDCIQNGGEVELPRRLFDHVIQVDPNRLVAPSRCRVEKL